MKPFLILQLRPEAEASDDEYQAFLDKTGLKSEETHRVCLDREELPQALNLTDYSGVIVGGGPGCVSDDPAKKNAIEARIEAAILRLMPEITKTDFPFMGCCYGIGILGYHLGADVSKRQYGEDVSATQCSVTSEGISDAMLAGCSDVFGAFVGHKEALQELPEGCVHLLSAPSCPYQMIRYKENVYATQFHPEADAKSFAVRIGVYKDRGYFPPEDAQRLIDMCHAADVQEPGRILKNFVEKYASPDG
ncbi:glutamine amidotransferase [Cochlodiniinecator piscidefendens]|uniref:glutamine amidotransferase n=1 Tax=Cochlodiniinecator piscidefendens TaxID=2715756 RepID=UPI00140BD03A|nr:glutamine amidotransferase [Cochlodiniinecator piscidefendens]